ncbi:MAG: hypothetical protein ACREXR_01260 [Gammaproteobacteria bacterium]
MQHIDKPLPLDRFIRALKDGVPPDAAFRRLGIRNRQAQDAWLDQDGNQALYDSAIDVFEERVLGYIHQAAESDLKAAQWLLERHPSLAKRYAIENVVKPVLEVVLRFNPLAPDVGRTVIEMPALPSPDV